MPDLDAWRWAVAALAALLIGVSRTGVPGAGILFVPLMVFVFGPQLAVGGTLPLLLLGDLWAVRLYRAHADGPALRRLAPWVAVGLLAGAGVLWGLGRSAAGLQVLERLIGGAILALLALALLQRAGRWRWQPRSAASVGLIGALTGLTTLVANAAGPFTNLYFSALGLSARPLLGTSAWLYLGMNLTKLPLLLVLGLAPGLPPLLTAQTLAVSAVLAPLVVVGALFGRALLGRLREDTFVLLLFVLSGVAALRLLF